MRMLTVNTFVRIVTRLLEVKARSRAPARPAARRPRRPTRCRSSSAPRCGTTVPLPSGDDILLQDLIALAGQIERG